MSNNIKDQQVVAILEAVINAKRIYRDRAAAAFLETPALIPSLIDKIFDVEDRLHIKAAWVFELVCLDNIAILDPYIHSFLNGMSSLKHESALRPASKICSLWTAYFFTQETSDVILSEADIEQIISCNFDWLIEDHKVATQVFAMDSLKYWSTRENWIQQELKSILQKNADTSSIGYRTHARKLLKNL